MAQRGANVAWGIRDRISSRWRGNIVNEVLDRPSRLSYLMKILRKNKRFKRDKWPQ